MGQRTTFRSARELFHADTCEPLKRAAADGRLHLSALGRGSYPGLRLPRHDLKELLMAGYWNAPGKQDWGLDWHCNEGIEIGYLSAGKLQLAVGEKQFIVRPGHLTITRPWQRHRVGDPNVPACHYSWIILDVGMRRPNQPWHWPEWLLMSKPGLKRLTEMLRQNEQPVWRGDPQIARAFKNLDETITRGGGGSCHAKLKVAINDLIIHLTELLESRNPHLDESLSSSERTVALFLENLASRSDEPWTLDSMAAACGLARTRFATLCRKLVNVAPVEHLTRCRLENASRLLQSDPGRSITDIAFAAGFQSSQYFARVFKEHHGHSPGRHRKRFTATSSS